MKLPPSKRWKKIQRRTRLDKIAKAQLTLEEELLRLRSMFGQETDEHKQAQAAFGSLYYLMRLAKRAP